MAEVYDLAVSAANNNDAPPNGAPENMQYSQVNNTIREQMAVLARYIQALSGITTTGLGNAYILTVTQAPTAGALVSGMRFTFKADKANTGASTLQINGIGAVAISDNNGVALASGAIVVDGLYLVQYDGTRFRIIGSESAANLKTKYESNADTNAFTDALLTKLNGIEASATGDQTAGEIKTAYESNANTNAFTDANSTKLSGIETGATADQTNAEIRTAVEAASDSNVFTDADHTKLNGVETGATADQTNTQIRDAVEAASNSNTFNDADHSKLNGIATGAQVNVSPPSATPTVAGVAEIATAAEVTAGTDNTRIVSPLRLAGALAGLGSVQTKFKTADQQISNSIALTQDTHLNGFTLVAGGYYNFRLIMQYFCNFAADFKFGLRFTNAPQVLNGALSLGSDPDITTPALQANCGLERMSDPAGTISILSASSQETFAVLETTIQANASTGGTFELQWAQSSLNAIASSMRKGSHGILTRLD